MNEIAIKIANALKASREPMTPAEIAEEIGVSRQTVFNHLGTAIGNGSVVDLGVTRGRSKLYASPEHEMVKYFVIPWKEGKPEPLRNLFIRWVNNPPSDDTLAVFANIVKNLYRTAADFVYDDGDVNESFMRKVIRLKEQRAYLGDFIRHLDTIKKAASTIYNSEELFHPRDIVSRLIIQDPDIKVQEILNVLDRKE